MMKCTEKTCRFPVTCEYNNTCMQHGINEAEKNRNKFMKKPTGIVERMKAAASLDEALKLTKEAEGYESMSSKTERKFLRIKKRKIKEFKSKGN